MNFFSDIRRLLLILWLGAACFFSFAVAPSAFAVLPSREVAGAIVSRALAIVNFSGLAVGLILLATSFIKQTGVNRFQLWAERFLLLILMLACAAGQFVIALWLSIIKAQIGRPIDEISVDDPLRIQFNNLHQYSVWVLVAAMIAALMAYFVMARRAEKILIPEKTNVQFN
ncbi:MAG: DUF4149 domain-containing protein [Acidobacteriota bacterium]|nr:DUF4149 domain-containing protein [Acidobacteriota bacterium]